MADVSADPPMAFAVMRNAHEAFRGAMKEMDDALVNADLDSFAKLWRDFQRAVQVHLNMEEFDLFPLLEQISGGAVSSAGLHDLHTADHDNYRAVNSLISAESPDVAQLQSAYESWKAFHIDHFVKEETVMMPVTMKTAPTPSARCVVAHETLICTALAREEAEFSFFVSWCVAMLSRHGSAQQAPNVATRVFVRALRAACSSEQWARLMPSIKVSCDPAIWAEMLDKYTIEQADSIVK
eukprot:gene28639-34576_t